MINKSCNILRKLSRAGGAGIHPVVVAAIYAMVLLLLVGCLAGCKAKTVVVTEYRDRVQHDTVQLVDSVYQYRYIAALNDTVYIHDSIDRFRWRDKVVEVYVHDSVPYEVEVIREVKKPLNGWQRFIQGSGYALWGMIIIGLVVLIISIIIKIKG